MSIYGLIGLSIVSCIVVIVVKQYKPEFAFITTIAAGSVILFMLLGRFTSVFNELKLISESAGIKSEYMEVMLKGLGICYLTQFSSDICNDFGQSSLASKIELCGKITLAVLSIPLLKSLIETISKVL